MYVRSVRVTGIESLESGSAKVEEDETARAIGTSFDLKFNDVYQVDLLFRHAGFTDVRQRYRLAGDLWFLGNGREDRGMPFGQSDGASGRDLCRGDVHAGGGRPRTGGGRSGRLTPRAHL